MRFSFRQLEYFVAAGETGSVTRAAQGSHSSQPTVSAAIAKLEAARARAVRALALYQKPAPLPGFPVHIADTDTA